ncbi:conserved hypothetical protein [Leishmania major strain Friedlin]|uniref:Uncharacterized protein n=1 Tax=Leishmania major TaxID=5664 RepID=Q4QCA7_LEIMA|nr:conserved hypothetical protein [Leishmania major strain Friedlin]CAG9573445.1 hypothetical_protein_-_conserved [Leishmania major strain Friedlin]CAJ04424.1 conserved hypothetical protein [Leishmania major strain Friedlin]|eukprot:XP_001683041.1 conserved hypothetical protein [Leishmania major strain Friedlin]
MILHHSAPLPRMVTLPGCTLHIAVDADLSVNFDRLLCPPHAGSNCVGVSSVAPSVAHATLFSNLPPRTQVRGVRQVNAVSQTVVLRLASSASSADSNGAVTPASTSALTRNTYVVVVLDAQQVPQMLSAATARRCPPHLSGAGPLGWYLDAVMAGLQQAKEAEENEVCRSGAVSALTDKDVNSSRTDQPSTTTRTLLARRRGTDGDVVHLSLIVVPNATVALSGLNSTNVNVTGAEAAALFSAAVAWSATRRVIMEVGDVEEPLADRNACSAAARRSHAVPVELDLCATAAHVQQAAQMIAALGNKLLKAWPTSATAVGSTSLFASDSAEASIADAADVRRDTQRKVIPSDFHALYTSMLTEVSSFSERKTMAALTAFPTMCHLLEYVDSIAGSAPGAQDGSGSGGDGDSDVAVHVPGAVYSINYGEHRSWNVLNSAIIEALVTEYER